MVEQVLAGWLGHLPVSHCGLQVADERGCCGGARGSALAGLLEVTGLAGFLLCAACGLCAVEATAGCVGGRVTGAPAELPGAVPVSSRAARPASAAARATASTTSVTRGRQRLWLAGRPGAWSLASGGSLAVASRLTAASSRARAAEALAGRSAGSFASSRAVFWSSRPGRPGRRADGGPGSSCTCR